MKVFILGLDGATFECLDPMIAAGMLPNVSKVCAQGVRSPMKTIFPPVTGPAWLALATGLNPGKTGVFDYINRTSAESDAMEPVSSAPYEGRAVWDYLGRQGSKVGIYNYPTLSPPPVVNGFSVSGMGGYKKERLCYPDSLEQELQTLTGGYEIQLNLRSAKYRNNEAGFLSDVSRVMEKQYRSMRYLMDHKEWDFFFGVFHFTDWMQHMLWMHIDASHPLHDPVRSPGIRQMFESVWQRIDEIVGELLDSLPVDAVFMIVSDHGAGAVDSAFFANSWLEKKGWLYKNASGWRNTFAARFRPLSSDVDNKYLSKALRILKRTLFGSQGVAKLIDQERSLAYSPEHAAMFGCINLTKKGKAESGFRDRLVLELSSLPREIASIKDIRVLLPEQLYSGPYVHLAPDVLFVINGYRTTAEVDFRRPAFSPEPSLMIRTGGHRDDGVFMAYGSHVKHTSLEGVSILDIAPTVLALFGIEIPKAMDGRVLEGFLRTENIDDFQLKRRDVPEEDAPRTASKGDLDEMRKTLESLGYM